MSAHATEPDCLEQVRAELDDIDRAVIQLISRRCALAGVAGRARHRAGLPSADLAREAAVLRQAAGAARSSRIDEESIRRIFWRLIDMSRRTQVAT